MSEVESLREVVQFFVSRIAGALQNCIEIENLRSENDLLRAKQIEATARTQAPSSDANSGHPINDRFIRIAQRVDLVSGTAFLREIVDSICEEYRLYAGGACALDPSPATQTLKSVSFRLNRQQCDPICYEAKGRPCEEILNHGSLCLPDNARKAYPNDLFFQEHAIRGVCGSRLPGPDGTTAGVIWVMSQDALPEPDAVQSLLKY